MTAVLEQRVDRPVAGSGRLPLVVAAGSLLYGVLGALWAYGVDGYPFGKSPPDFDRIAPLSFLPEWFGAGLVAVLGLVGVPVALAIRRTDWSGSVARPLLVVAAAQAVVFGLLGPDNMVVSGLGYLLVLLGLPALMVLLIAGALRQPATRLLVLLVAAVLLTLGLGTDLLKWSAFVEIGKGLATVPGKFGFRPLLMLGGFALGIGWAMLALRTLRGMREQCQRCGRPGADWTRPERARRWGYWATLVAVLCPMPYALLRFTWLTPWPLGFRSEDLAAEPGIRLFGLALGTIAFSAGIVCLGLIRPWGEVWPRWVPWLAGRPVPMKAVLIPGGIAAAALLVGSTPMITMILDHKAGVDWEAIKLLLIFPFPLWGASVGLATLAYYYRRRTACAACQQA